MNEPVTAHIETRTVRAGWDSVDEQYNRSGHLSMCTCGASWTHPLNRTSAEMDAIFTSHATYNKPMTVTL